MVQHLIILLVFIAAAFYMARLLYGMFRSTSSGCPKGCGSCSTIDMKKIEADIKHRKEMMSPK